MTVTSRHVLSYLMTSLFLFLLHVMSLLHPCKLNHLNCHTLYPDFTHMSKDTRFYSILLYCNWQKAWAACSLAKYREEGGKSKEERLIEERGEEKGRGYHRLWLLSGYSSENWNPGLGHFCFSVSGIHNLQLLYIRVLNETSTEDCSEFIH